jgi:ketol-acid reductoisomerase
LDYDQRRIRMAKIDFGGMVEEVVMRDEFPLEKAREVLSDEVVAVLGSGPGSIS